MNRGLLLLLALGCGSAADGALDTTYESTSNDPAWDCLSATPEMAPREPGRVTYTVPVVDADGAPLVPSLEPGFGVDVCRDAGCSSALPRCDDVAVPGGTCYELAAGTEPNELVFGFSYGLDTTIRVMMPGYVPLYYPLGGPVVGTPSGSMEIAGSPLELMSTEANLYLSDPPSPTRSSLRVRMLDCAGAPAEGLELTIVDGNSANAVAIEDGFTNLFADRFTVSAVGSDGGEYMRTDVTVHVGAVTTAELRPGLGVWGQ